MRFSDLSSDVCSSDLQPAVRDFFEARLSTIDPCRDHHGNADRNAAHDHRGSRDRPFADAADLRLLPSFCRSKEPGVHATRKGEAMPDHFTLTAERLQLAVPEADAQVDRAIIPLTDRKTSVGERGRQEGK